MSERNEDYLYRLKAEYLRLMHAVQSGIKIQIESGQHLASPKDLRVGVDSAMVSDLALARLLMDKGVFTEAEYLEYLVQAAKDEKNHKVAEIRELLGTDKVELA